MLVESLGVKQDVDMYQAWPIEAVEWLYEGRVLKLRLFLSVTLGVPSESFKNPQLEPKDVGPGMASCTLP